MGYVVVSWNGYGVFKDVKNTEYDIVHLFAALDLNVSQHPNDY